MKTELAEAQKTQKVMLKDIKAFSTFSQKKEAEINILKEQKAAISKSKGKGNK